MEGEDKILNDPAGDITVSQEAIFSSLLTIT